MSFLGDTLAWAVGDNFTVYRFYLPKSARIILKPIMVLSTPVLDFGLVAQNGVRGDTVIVTNTGNDSLRIWGAAITNDAMHSFVLGTFFPVAIGPGDSLAVVVDFAPTFLLQFNSELYIYSNADTQKVHLRGTGHVVGVNEGAVIAANGFHIYGYPNPFRSIAELGIAGGSSIPDGATVKIYDALGREVDDLTSQFRRGESHVMLNGEHLPAGTYIARLHGPACDAMQQFVLVH